MNTFTRGFVCIEFKVFKVCSAPSESNLKELIIRRSEEQNPYSNNLRTKKW